MSQVYISRSYHIREGYDPIVILPLIIVTLFCFGLIMIHPFNKTKALSPKASHSNTIDSQKSKSVININNLPYLQNLTPIPSSGSSIPVDNSTLGASPQSSNSSKSGSDGSILTNLQPSAGSLQSPKNILNQAINLPLVNLVPDNKSLNTKLNIL